MLTDKLRHLRDTSAELNILIEKLSDANRAVNQAAQGLQIEVDRDMINVGDVLKLDGVFYRLQRRGGKGPLELTQHGVVKEFG